MLPLLVGGADVSLTDSLSRVAEPHDQLPNVSPPPLLLGWAKGGPGGVVGLELACAGGAFGWRLYVESDSRSRCESSGPPLLGDGGHAGGALDGGY